MIIDLEKIHQFKSKIKLEQLYNYLISMIIVLIIILSYFALYRPINVQQHTAVIQLSQQHSFPATQEMAEKLSLQRQISMREYVKLIQAYQQESQRAHQLPDAVQEGPF